MLVSNERRQNKVGLVFYSAAKLQNTFLPCDSLNHTEAGGLSVCVNLTLLQVFCVSVICLWSFCVQLFFIVVSCLSVMLLCNFVTGVDLQGAGGATAPLLSLAPTDAPPTFMSLK